MNEILAQWQEKLDKLNQRERLLVMLSMLAVVGFILYQLIVEPFSADRQRLQLQANDLQAKMAESLAQQQTLQAVLSGAMQSPLMQRRDQLNTSIADNEQTLNESVNTLISPAAMAEVLESVLSKNKNLKLIRLENLPVEPLLQDKNSPTGTDTKNDSVANAQVETAQTETVDTEKTGTVLFQHAFIIEMRGDYPAIRQYLRDLSTLPWRFYWDEMDYQVDVYPQATIKIRVHTVSLAEEWIRV